MSCLKTFHILYIRSLESRVNFGVESLLVLSTARTSSGDGNDIFLVIAIALQNKEGISMEYRIIRCIFCVIMFLAI